MNVAVVIPTVPGREEELDRAETAFMMDAASGEYTVRVYVETGHASVGSGWNAGVDRILSRRVLPEFVLLSNDDVHPHAGWFAAARRVSDQGGTPCPVCYRPDGSVESGGVFGRSLPSGSATDWTPLCFFRLDEWKRFGPLPSIHYWSDNAFSAASIITLRRAIIVEPLFAVTHTWAMPGRKSMSTPEAIADRAAFEAYVDALPL